MDISGWQYTGIDGSVWLLSDGGAPVQLSGEGVDIFGAPPRNIRFEENAISAGRRRTSVVHEARVFPMTVTLNAAGNADLEATSEAWWRAWSATEPGKLTMFRPSGEARSLRVYCDDDRSREDPLLDPMGVLEEYEVTMTISADDPIVYGAEITIGPFFADDLNLFANTSPEGVRYGPPYNLYDAEQVGRRDVVNPGTLPAWPVWTITGPVDKYRFQVGSSVLGGELAVAAGMTLTIDTRTGRKSAYLSNGRTRTLVTDSALSDWGFAALPPGKTTVTIAFEGNGSIRGDIVASYERLF